MTNATKVLLENVEILFPNFAGRTSPYNQLGKRSFSVVLNDEQAKALTDMGFNVRMFEGGDEEDIAIQHLPINVNFQSRYPPAVYAVYPSRRLLLDENNVGMLDHVRITNVDVEFNPYHWTAPGKSGVAAYATTVYATVESSTLDEKYANVPLVGVSEG